MKKHPSLKWPSILFGIVTTTFLCFPIKVYSENLDSILQVLDECIIHRSAYEQQFIRQTDSLRLALKNTSDKGKAAAIWLQIARKEFYHSSSNTLEALNEGYKLATEVQNKQAALECLMIKAMLYGNLGLPWEGERILQSITDLSTLSTETQKNILTAYNDLYDFYRTGKLPEEVADRKLRQIIPLTDSLKKHLPTKAQQAINFAYSSSNIPDMIKQLKNHLDTIPNEQKAMVAAVISNKYFLLKDIPKRDYYLALSSIYCLRYTRYEYASLLQLAAHLSELGDSQRAIQYSITAYQMAEIWGSDIRKAAVAQTLSTELTNQTQQNTNLIHQLSNRNTLLIGGICLLLCLTAYSLRNKHLFNKRQTQERQTREQMKNQLGELQTDLQVKNEYITRFLELSLDAVFEVEQLRRTVLMRLKAGETERLQKTLNEKKQFDTFQSECLKRFDISFLRLYPDFIQSVNKLFKPEEQITLSDTEILNHELRILAFMKIEVNDSSRIATILGISINTVYFYRNRSKKRAVNRASFEKDIANI